MSRETAKEKMLKLRESGTIDIISPDFLLQAAEQIIECRRVLKYTYVHGYFLEEGRERDLFEHHQKLLEEHTEKLHGYTELKPDLMDGNQILNLVRVSQNFLSGLLTSLADPEIDTMHTRALGAESEVYDTSGA